MSVIVYTPNPYLQHFNALYEREREKVFSNTRTCFVPQFSFLTYMVNESIFQILGLLGRGTYAKVYKARDLASHRIVALKIGSGDTISTLKRESRIIRRICTRSFQALQHIPNLLLEGDALKVGSSKERYALVFELLGTCLGNVTALTTREIQVITSDLARGLLVLKNAGVVHGDLKPQNVLLNRSSFLKIIDFGLSKEFELFLIKFKKWRPLQATWYRAPEVWLWTADNPYALDYSIDMWSVGCIIAEMKKGYRLFLDFNDIVKTLGPPPPQFAGSYQPNPLSGPPTSLEKRIFGGLGAQTESDRLLSDLLNHILQYDAAKRPTPQEVLDHPFVKMASVSR